MKRIISLLAAISVFAGCNSLDQYPYDRFTEETWWTSPDKALSVLNKAYHQMNDAEFNYNLEALTDNSYQRRTHDEKIVSSGLADASNAKFLNTWKRCYTCIKTCHIFLENVDRVPDMDPVLRERTKAEARFIRAYNYLLLTTFFGDVPYFTKTISLEESKTIGRTAHAEVVSKIVAELDEIAPSLPKREDYATADRGRITRGAAIMLKARAYLYDNDWSNCLAACKELMDSSDNGTYALYPDFADLFTVKGEYCSEIILDIQYLPVLRMWSEYQDFMPPSVGGRVSKQAPTKELVDDFIMINGKGILEDGSGFDENNPYVGRDPRLDMTVVRHGGTWTMPDGTQRIIYTKPGSTPPGNPSSGADEWDISIEKTSPSGYYYKKGYDNTSINDYNSGMNVILMRWADVLLMYAECAIESDSFDETTWNRTIKALRLRAGFPDGGSGVTFDPSWTKDQLRTIVRRERRSELAFEGTRIYDIRRWRTAEVVLNGRSHGDRFDNGNTEYIQLGSRSFNPERDYLWPVPQTEKDINPNLGQNPNY